MGKRFGRNQKRKMREQIADLGALLKAERFLKSRAEGARDSFVREGMERVLNDDRFALAKREIVDELFRFLAPELEKPARELLKSMERHNTPMSPTFAVHEDWKKVEVCRVSGRISSAEYNVQVAQY
mgnify:CR=1 FL=1